MTLDFVGFVVVPSTLLMLGLGGCAVSRLGFTALCPRAIAFDLRLRLWPPCPDSTHVVSLSPVVSEVELACFPLGFALWFLWLRRLRLLLFGCRWLDGRLSSTSVTVLPTLTILAFDLSTSGPL